MKLMRYFFLLCLSVFLFNSACDRLEAPYKDLKQLQSANGKKVLVEDFTGHYCGNCPAAHDIISSLDSVVGENMIVVAIHATDNFAKPRPNRGYVADYRTPVGDALEQYFEAGLAGLPKIMVNRKEYNGTVLQESANLSTVVNQELQEVPKMSLDVTTSYIGSSRELSVTVNAEYFENGGSDDRLMVYVTEDSIVSQQLVVLSDVPNYTHRHILRSSLTAIWGDQVAATPLAAGDIYTTTYTTELDTAWDAQHCSVVAFIMDGTTREVFQVDEEHLKLN